ncbi:hypothetical protein EAO69_21860 [Streptomyces sp. me109]|nr:hypothetical protein EAO69_21860 [Streptomyces sp. me109]
MCRSIICAAATLSLENRLAWRVIERPHPGTRALVRELRDCIMQGQLFRLPRAISGRSTIPYAVPDAAFSLALLCLWFEGIVTEDAPATSSIAHTYLGTLLPPQSADDTTLLRSAVSGFTS